ncbi:MAG: hypothetical protein INR66_04050 [Gordonia polyisoprenivorans]|nr:hypothetical protein [Gordonia polyisoprenivorans]
MRSIPRLDPTTWALAAVPPALGVLVLITATGPGRFLADVPILGRMLADTDKVWVVALWLLVASIVLGALIQPRGGSALLSRTVVLATSSVGTGLVVVLGAWRDPSLHPEAWEGFGPVWWLAGALIAVAAVFVQSRMGWSSSRVLLGVSGAAAALLCVVPLLQTTHGFSVGYDNSFTLNEILAPSAGRLAGFDFAQQYTVLLGLPLALVRMIFPDAFDTDPASWALGWVIVLQVVTLAAGTVAGLLNSDRRSAWSVPLVVVGVTFLAGGGALYYYADLPLRFVMPALLYLSVVVVVRRGLRAVGVLAIGAAAGAAALNNVEFGVPALLATAATVVVATPTLRSAATRLVVLVGGAALSLVAYLGLGMLFEGRFRTSYLTFIARNFGGGNTGDVDMPVWGLHLAFVALGVASLVYGVIGSRGGSGRTRRRRLALVWCSAWLVLSLVYYSGRSLTPTLVAGSCFPAALVLSCLVPDALVVLGATARLLRRRRFRAALRQRVLASFLVLAAVCAAWLGYPGWGPTAMMFERTARDRAVPLFLEPDPRPALRETDRRGLIGAIAVSGFDWQLRTGVRDVGLFSFPGYIGFPGAQDAQCEYLRRFPGDHLLTTRSTAYALSLSQTCQADFDFSKPRLLGRIPSYPTLGRYMDRWIVLSRR